ncbi:MAG: NAD-dependent epimerase/dehydratase family protein [Verrucomicrobia bacterium]|nr:NAD-dependent epimerase/dehydratase family protein [Verrucomicrobiota bacterium]
MAASPLILVTGGTGFIGRHLVAQLLDAGARVRVFCRSAAKAESLFGGTVDVAEGDLDSEAALRDALRGVGRVYHLAGLYTFGWRHRAALWRTNVDGTRRLLAAARRAGVERLVHCSTAGILAARGRRITPEDLPDRPPTGCPYKQSKWHAEQAARAAAATGQPVIIANPTAPIGPGDERPTPTGRMVLDLLEGRFPACSRTGINVIAVEDLAAGLIAVGRQGEPGRRHLLGGQDLWLEDFLSRVAAHAGRPAPRAWVPWAAVAAGGLLGDLSGLLLRRGDSRLCWETAYFARQVQFFDLASTQRALGWRAVRPLEDTLASTVAWFAARSRSGCRTPGRPGDAMPRGVEGLTGNVGSIQSR